MEGAICTQPLACKVTNKKRDNLLPQSKNLSCGQNPQTEKRKNMK
jgi:hypothetical protein